MQNKRVLVTGATDGIGLQTARDLASLGADVILHGRNPARLLEVRRELEKLTKRKLPDPVCADFSRLADVRRLSDELNRHALHVLINNAGVFMNEHQLTVDGFETTLAVNYLAPFALTHLVMPALVAAGEARVVNVSSIAHQSGRIDPDDFVLGRRFSGYGAYAASKLANILFTLELVRRLGSRSITVNALHPGVVSTKLLQAGFGMGGPDSLPESAATSVYLASSDEVRDVTGAYFVRAKRTAPAAAAKDTQLCQRLYERTAAAVGVDPLAP